ncbi:hypothetical protein RND71_002160 [Anisodus tanguticus]|uniref:Uncharacterized protein n=1 Tax=Anisodus tanguticus TaxID=243964 RepID=A0AAE1T2J4_9SOLA|nr:hypothetical protein RND71_002160 [Anisodus tanguticus]
MPMKLNSRPRFFFISFLCHEQPTLKLNYFNSGYDMEKIRSRESNNNFTGKIQDFKSKILGAVVLRDNQLQGPIPKSLLNQHSLVSLILSQNNLSGQIASAICNLKTLQVLDLGSNYLKGIVLVEQLIQLLVLETNS